MLSVAERLAGCMMYIKEVMYIIQSQQVQHNRNALLLTPQVTSAIPSLSYTAKRTAAADHRPACLCGTCDALSLALVALRLHAARYVRGVVMYTSVRQYYITAFQYTLVALMLYVGGVVCDGYITG